MEKESSEIRMVAVNRGVENVAGAGRTKGAWHEALEAWVGRWINTGHTVDEAGGAGLTIITSDVYEWAPGGFFLVHTAYGRVGEFGGGAIEMIGYDETGDEYTSHLFDSQGNVILSRLVNHGDNTWTYEGDTTRSTVVFSADHRVQTVLHERTDDGSTYRPSMQVTLVKVD
jgi:hypothetical protein